MYSIFDIALNSDIPLPELTEIETAEVVINVRAGETKENTLEQPPVWIHHWRETDNSISISCAKQQNTYLLRFPDLIDFIISKSGESIRYYPKKGLPPETIRHLLLDQVVPRVIGHQGRLVLHASAIEVTNNINIAFIGESGHGKSTIASSFHQSGAKLITDDCLLLDEQDGNIVGIPNYYGVRLYEDSATAIFGKQQPLLPVAHYSTKNRFHLPPQTCQDRKTQSSLSALFLLFDPTRNNEYDDVVITPVKGAEELISLIKQTFILDVTDKSSSIKQFKNVSKLISSNIRIFRLQYPRRYDRLPTVRAQIKGVL